MSELSAVLVTSDETVPPGALRPRRAAAAREARPATARASAGARLGWLLQGWRRRCLPESTARGFAPMLGVRGVPADASRVSRWESGQLAVPFVVLDGYERTLGLPAGTLTGIGAAMRRTCPPPAAAVRRALEPLDHLEGALETVAFGSPVGTDWLALARLVAQRADDVALPWTMWRTATTRLVGGLGRSVGHAYVTRFEAATLLTEHPRARHALVLGIGEHVTDPDCPLALDAVSVLQHVPGPQAGDLVVKLVGHEKPQVRRAAVWAATGKAARGDLDDLQLRRLVPAARRLVAADLEEHGHLQSITTDLVRLLPSDVIGRLAAEHPRLVEATAPAGVDLSSLLGDLVTSCGEPATADPVMESLVDEALFAGTDELRHHASLVLMCSPAREAVAARCAAAAERVLVAEVPGPVVHRLLERLSTLLGYVATEQQRPVLESLVAGGGRVARVAALVGLGRLERSDRPGELALLIRGRDEAVALAAVHCAGMTGHPDLVPAAAVAALQQERRRAAAWWLRTGPALRD
jgi:hypothetical protein